MGYSKLFSEIVMSTIWREPNHVRIVWITMLALKDRFHCVNASIPGLADAAKVSIAECEEALRILLSPDPYSRTVENEGRRIKKVEGGWAVLNGEKYRNKMSLDERREYQRIKQREYRQKVKDELEAKQQEEKDEQNQRSSMFCQQNSQQLTHTDTDTYSNTEEVRGVLGGKNELPKPEPTPKVRSRSPRATPQSDEEWLNTLKSNPAYSHIDFEVEMGKLDAWLSKPENRGKQKTHQRILNWLGKVERPINLKPKTIAPKPKSQEDLEWERRYAETYEKKRTTPESQDPIGGGPLSLGSLVNSLANSKSLAPTQNKHATS